MVIQYREDELLYIIKENIHPRYPNIALKKWLLLSNELNKYELIEDLNNWNCIHSYSENVK